MEQNQQPQPPAFPPQQPPQRPQYQPQQPQYQPEYQPQYQPRVTARPMMGFVEAVKTCLRKYFDFSGRARRSEFWWFVLFILLVSFFGSLLVTFLTTLICNALGVDPTKPVIIVMSLLILALIIPNYAVLTRRLHDSGRSGWWIAIYFISAIVYSASYFIIMWPLLDKLGTATDPFALSGMMTSAMMQSPIAASLMSISGILVFILFIIIFIFTLLDSKWGENKYGPSPKYQ